MIQCRALTALNALTPIVSVSDLGEKRNLDVVWNSLYGMASDKKPGKFFVYFICIFQSEKYTFSKVLFLC